MTVAALLALVGCPASPPLQVPPTEEVYAPGPVVEERPIPVTDAGALAGGDGGSALPPAPAAITALLLADGEPCLVGEECESGVCEGQGCGDDQPGRCAPAERRCSTRGAEFCGCEGDTFSAATDCPGQRYAHRNACGAP